MNDKKTRVALWQDNAADGGKPCLKGKIEFPDGSKKNIALWRNDNDKRGAPTFTGEIDEIRGED